MSVFIHAFSSVAMLVQSVEPATTLSRESNTTLEDAVTTETLSESESVPEAGKANEGCPENTPKGRQADAADCILKVGMTKKEVKAALGGSPLRETPGRDGDRVCHYESKRADGSTIILVVVFDKKKTVRFWRSYAQS